MIAILLLKTALWIALLASFNLYDSLRMSFLLIIDLHAGSNNLVNWSANIGFLLLCLFALVFRHNWLIAWLFNSDFAKIFAFSLVIERADRKNIYLAVFLWFFFTLRWSKRAIKILDTNISRYVDFVLCFIWLLFIFLRTDLLQLSWVEKRLLVRSVINIMSKDKRVLLSHFTIFPIFTYKFFFELWWLYAYFALRINAWIKWEYWLLFDVYLMDLW